MFLDGPTNGFHRRTAPCLPGFKVKPAGEDAEPREERALAFVEQVVTPRDRVAEGLLALWPVPCTAGQELQALGQTFDHRGWREQTRACGGKLDRQRQPVQAQADFRDG